MQLATNPGCQVGDDRSAKERMGHLDHLTPSPILDGEVTPRDGLVELHQVGQAEQVQERPDVDRDADHRDGGHEALGLGTAPREARQREGCIRPGCGKRIDPGGDRGGVELVGQGQRLEWVAPGVVEETLGGSLADGDATSSAKQRIELWGRQTSEGQAPAPLVLAQPGERGERRDIRPPGDHDHQPLVSEATQRVRQRLDRGLVGPLGIVDEGDGRSNR